MDKHSKAVARVAIDRTIRFGRAPTESRKACGTVADLSCSSCGIVLCKASRLWLFRGMVLTCASCGETNRVTR